MGTSDDKLKNSERVRRVLDFIFGFCNRRGTVVNHWIDYAEGFSLDPTEFYSLVERKFAEFNIPGMTASRQEFAEGGLLSEQRLYLRFLRERWVIDTCAAPYGDKLYFFSFRVVYVPALVRLWHIIAALAFFVGTGYLLIKPLGLPFAIIAQIALLFALVGVLRNAGNSAFNDLDALLLRIPVVATIYEDWFRMETYHREDSRVLYIKLLPLHIEAVAKELCAAQGIKLVPGNRSLPRLFEMSRTVPPKVPES